MNEQINFWDIVNSWTGRFSAIVALVGVLYTIYRGIKSAIQKILSISTKIQHINDQLTSNGGKSLVDVVQRIEARQIRNEQRERAFLQHHSSPMFELDSLLALKWANASFLRSVQLDSDEINGYGWHNAICEKDRERVVEEFEKASNASRNIQLVCTLSARGECTEQYVMSATVMRDINNKSTGFFVNFTSPSLEK